MLHQAVLVSRRQLLPSSTQTIARMLVLFANTPFVWARERVVFATVLLDFSYLVLMWMVVPQLLLNCGFFCPVDTPGGYRCVLLKERPALLLLAGQSRAVILPVGNLEEGKLRLLLEIGERGGGGFVFGLGFGSAEVVQLFAVVGVGGKVGDLSEKCQMKYCSTFHYNKIYPQFINTILWV